MSRRKFGFVEVTASEMRGLEGFILEPDSDR